MEPIIGHEAVLRELQGLAESPEPAHAMMLIGPDSVGRVPVATRYAMMLNCEAVAPAGASLFEDAPPIRRTALRDLPPLQDDRRGQPSRCPHPGAGRRAL
ncbi:MAG: hypothetical protein U5Q44_11580 [Dehalococcoidia bacterium]|nr:hypothetical protein [Dehalococcoidia bacterium]